MLVHKNVIFSEQINLCCVIVYNIQVTKREVVNNYNLLNAFQLFVRSRQSSTVDDSRVTVLFKEILTRVVNTMSSSFLCMDLLERVSTRVLMQLK